MMSFSEHAYAEGFAVSACEAKSRAILRLQLLRPGIQPVQAAAPPPKVLRRPVGVLLAWLCAETTGMPPVHRTPSRKRLGILNIGGGMRTTVQIHSYNTCAKSKAFVPELQRSSFSHLGINQAGPNSRLKAFDPGFESGVSWDSKG
jgi:hypothetical protein